MDELLARWVAAARGAGVTAGEPDLRAAGEALLARWDEPHRHYHTRAHLRAVLDVVDAAASHAARPDLVRLAAWWHDAIYDPRATGDVNERDSAALAERTLAALGAPAPVTAEVARLVLITADHAAEAADRDAAVLCDADLAVLAADPAGYRAYAEAVRREYAHVPDAAFREGRAAVLRRVLGLPALYRLPHLRAAWEDRARANLTSELTGLTS